MGNGLLAAKNVVVNQLNKGVGLIQLCPLQLGRVA